MDKTEDTEPLVLDNGIILCWNRDYPDAWPLDDYEAVKTECDQGGYVERQWSVGQRKNIPEGTKAFLLAQGQQHPRGIVGYGIVTEEPFEDEHWQDPNKTTNYVRVLWVGLRDLDDPIPVAILMEQTPSLPWRTGIQGSGFPVSPEDAETLLSLLDFEEVGASDQVAEELTPGHYWEGAAVLITVNRYERDRAARAVCLRHHGYTCQACDADLTKTYGPELGRRAIHVHHIVPMAEQGGEGYHLDPINDLVPLCPNCHNVIHKTKPVMTPAQFRKEVLRK